MLNPVLFKYKSNEENKMKNLEILKKMQSVDNRKGNYYLVADNAEISNRNLVDALADFVSGNCRELHGAEIKLPSGKTKDFRQFVNFMSDHFGGINEKNEFGTFFAILNDFLNELPVRNTAN